MVGRNLGRHIDHLVLYLSNRTLGLAANVMLSALSYMKRPVKGLTRVRGQALKGIEENIHKHCKTPFYYINCKITTEKCLKMKSCTCFKHL